MLPSQVAAELQRAVADYLQTTFAFTRPELQRALEAFIADPERGLFKGPYFSLQLPYKKAAADARIPLDLRPAFTPFVHRLLAVERLTSQGGHAPEHTLVTTGTGSGKTEAFLYPILDHCLRTRAEPGIKAILLYPMNALVTDQ